MIIFEREIWEKDHETLEELKATAAEIFPLYKFGGALKALGCKAIRLKLNGKQAGSLITLNDLSPSPHVDPS